MARIMNEQSELPFPLFSLWLWYIHEMCCQLNCRNNPCIAEPACSGLPINRVNVVKPCIYFKTNSFYYIFRCSQMTRLSSNKWIKIKLYINQRFFHSKRFSHATRWYAWRFPNGGKSNDLSQRIWFNRTENDVCNKV